MQKQPTNKKRLDETGSDFSTLISGNCLATEDGKPRILYLEMGDVVLDELAVRLRSIRYEKSGRTGGLPSVSRTFGYQPRVTLRRDFCGAASLNSEEPSVYRLIQQAADIAAGMYAVHNLTLHDIHAGLTARVMNDYRIGLTPFTSGIINLNNQLRYHYDSGNFKDVWSAMFVFKKGIEGGHLCCPEYGIAFELKHKSLLLFDGQSVLHGVTPITLTAPSSYRISIVFYSLAGMWKCLTPAEELARIRKVKTEREKGGPRELPNVQWNRLCQQPQPALRRR